MSDYYKTQAWRDENSDEGRDDGPPACSVCATALRDDRSYPKCCEPACSTDSLCRDCAFTCQDCGASMCQQHACYRVVEGIPQDIRCIICQRARQRQQAA